MVGTALLCAPESGTSAPYRAALSGDRDTVVTRAFSGRPARGLRNTFIDQYDADRSTRLSSRTSSDQPASQARRRRPVTRSGSTSGPAPVFGTPPRNPAATILSGLTARP